MDWLTGRARTSLSTTIPQRTPADISGRKYLFQDNLYQTNPSLYFLSWCSFMTHCTRHSSMNINEYHYLCLEVTKVRRILSSLVGKKLVSILNYLKFHGISKRLANFSVLKIKTVFLLSFFLHRETYRQRFISQLFPVQMLNDDI